MNRPIDNLDKASTTSIIAIVGATASGKSCLAEALAKLLDADIVSADSMQVYLGMDIGTAKPRFDGTAHYVALNTNKNYATKNSVDKNSPDKNTDIDAEDDSDPGASIGINRVRYHCIDIVSPGEEFTAALYQRHARQAIEEIMACGKQIIVCGGTGLYVRAALDDFRFDVADVCPDWSVSEDALLRTGLEAKAKELGAAAFHASLAKCDPQSAALIHPNNVRRVVRAFELLQQGSSYAKQTSDFSSYKPFFNTRYIGVSVEPEVLYRSINKRVDDMVADGLLEEVEGLLSGGFRAAITAKQAIGYKEIVAYFDGDCSLEQAIESIKQATRRYAKRQRTWFRRDTRIAWIEASDLHLGLLEERISSQLFTQSLLERAQLLLK